MSLSIWHALSNFIYSSVTVWISTSLFEPLMASGMSEACSNDVVHCLTPLTDSWGPPYDKYHITQLTLAIQTINYSISYLIQHVRCLAETCLLWFLVLMNPSLTWIESIISFKVFLNITWAMLKWYDPWVSWQHEKRKIGYNISCNNFFLCLSSLSNTTIFFYMFKFWFNIQQFYYRKTRMRRDNLNIC